MLSYTFAEVQVGPVADSAAHVPPSFKTEIVERGDHKALLAMKGIYSGLWNRQIRAEEEGATDVGKDTLKPTTISGDSSRPGTPASGSHVPTQHGHGHP